MEGHRDPIIGPHFRNRDWKAVRIELERLDVARLKPALDESCRQPDSLRLRGVIGNQTLGQ